MSERAQLHSKGSRSDLNLIGRGFPDKRVKDSGGPSRACGKIGERLSARY